ncbi:MAG TPA: ABC transporter ATP-binding protein [Acidimicrobiales bacterium]|nr:ABC transporter ATP-binding protein [Acidimicrobiales bacterium]
MTREGRTTPHGPGADARRPRPVACRCRRVSVEFESTGTRRRILEGVTFDLFEGEFVAIMGRSGTGKTTLLRVLGGLLDATPDATITFNGQPVDGPPEGVVFVFQNYAASLLPWRTVDRNVALGLEGRESRNEIESRVAEALAMVGLSDRAKDHPWQLSGGMQQRVQLARSLAMRPCGLLMDEPFGSLDAMTKASLQDELQRVHQRTGATVAFVTHDIDEAVFLSDRVLILEGAPATIGHEIPVDLPRPRDQLTTKETPEFLQLRRRVYDALLGTDG